MSILNINIHNIFEIYKQDFDVSLENKNKYGEVRTDYLLINKMFDLLPHYLFEKINIKWFDPCCGNGYFMILLFYKLFISLKHIIKNDTTRKYHIISNMLFMNELNTEHIKTLKSIFGEHANIYNQDYLTMKDLDADVIVVNPPFNYGAIKTPTNNNLSKKNDGKSIWQYFIKKTIHQLNDNKHLLTIIPSIWMKQTHDMHNFITQFDIKKLHTLTSTETNKIFHKKAQTPTCYFHLIKKPTNNYLNIYDNNYNTYVTFPIKYNLPVSSISVIKKLLLFVDKFNHIDNIYKTNIDPGVRSNKTLLSDKPNIIYKYKNIKTCFYKNHTKQFDIKYSNKPCKYYNIKKIIMANKMYGLPYYDNIGEYGIITRDNYVITNKNEKQFLKIQKYFSTKLIKYVFESTRYRMKNLDIACFYFIPDIIEHLTLEQFNDDYLFDFFNLDHIERKIINDLYN